MLSVNDCFVLKARTLEEVLAFDEGDYYEPENILRVATHFANHCGRNCMHSWCDECLNSFAEWDKDSVPDVIRFLLAMSAGTAENAYDALQRCAGMFCGDVVLAYGDRHGLGLQDAVSILYDELESLKQTVVMRLEHERDIHLRTLCIISEAVRNFPWTLECDANSLTWTCYFEQLKATIRDLNLSIVKFLADVSLVAKNRLTPMGYDEFDCFGEDRNLRDEDTTEHFALAKEASTCDATDPLRKELYTAVELLKLFKFRHSTSDRVRGWVRREWIKPFDKNGPNGQSRFHQSQLQLLAEKLGKQPDFRLLQA